MVSVLGKDEVSRETGSVDEDGGWSTELEESRFYIIKSMKWDF
jgi:hypothetical protein